MTTISTSTKENCNANHYNVYIDAAETDDVVSAIEYYLNARLRGYDTYTVSRTAYLTRVECDRNPDAADMLTVEINGVAHDTNQGEL